MGCDNISQRLGSREKSGCLSIKMGMVLRLYSCGSLSSPISPPPESFPGPSECWTHVTIKLFQTHVRFDTWFWVLLLESHTQSASPSSSVKKGQTPPQPNTYPRCHSHKTRLPASLDTRSPSVSQPAGVPRSGGWGAILFSVGSEGFTETGTMNQRSEGTRGVSRTF